MAECNFEPELYQSKLEGMNDNLRDLDEFLEDQQRFQQKKEEKIEERKIMAIGKEIEGVSHEPQLDDLSVAIVEMMEDRK